MAEYFDEDINVNDNAGKHYDYVFTLNNYTDEHINAIRLFSEQCTYLVYQHERGEQGTPHLQGFMRFRSRRSFRAILRTLELAGLRGIHLEPRQGSIGQAIEYCTRDDKRDHGSNPAIVEYGRRPAGAGARSDLRALYDRAQQGASTRELLEANPEAFIRYSRGIERMRFIMQIPRRWKTEVRWYYGGTGTGKSRLADNEAGDAAYWKPGASKWWDGYESQANVIIDDYRCDMCPFHVLLKLFDRYPCIVETKGGSVQFCARIIWVTAPSRPEVMWAGRCDEDIQQLLRRIEVVREFGPAAAAHAPTFHAP